MASRVGGFSGTLDPFGSGRGGLGRYNITGETISSLEAYEAYAVAVAWANGEASDEEYIASLQRMVDVSVPGTRERITNENRLADAKYSIGRNVLARDVNNATSMTARVAALRKLLAYDEARRDAMDPDNEAYREQVDRIAGLRGDIRQTQYSDLVTKVNRGMADTAALLAMARGFASASVGDPDADEWEATVVSLKDRVADEKITDGYQAYQHNRMSGAKLLGLLQARMAGMDPDSAAYKDLANQAEDLRERIKTDDRQKREYTMQGRRNDGKVTDKEFLGYLQDEYSNTEPGTSENIAAGNRLREFTFSLAEDKLRYDVTKGKRPVSALISFYRSARAGMEPGSERYRSLTLAIDRLKGGSGGGGGGGGGGGRGSGSGISLGPKQMPGTTFLADVLGSGKAPPGFGDLFNINVNSVTSRDWWDNNLRSMVDSFQDGKRYWLYYDKAGVAHELPFTPDMMSQMDLMNYEYTRIGLTGADSTKERQMWVGRGITALKALESRGGQYHMDVYQKTWKDIERAKQAALAGGRFAEYANLVEEQTKLARSILNLAPSDPLDVRYATNPMLTEAQRAAIAGDLSAIAPRDIDASSDFYNPGGDAVLGLMLDGGIITKYGRDGMESAQIDPNRGYLQQNVKTGAVELKIVDMDAPGGAVADPATGQLIPAYLANTVAVMVRIDGEDVAVRQEITDTLTLPVWTQTTGAASTVVREEGTNAASIYVPGGKGPKRTPPERGFGPRKPGVAPPPRIPGTSSHYDPLIVGGAQATIPLRSIQTLEGRNPVTWVSLDGTTWLRVDLSAGGVAPRVVMAPDVTFDEATGQWMKGDKPVTDFRDVAHWWNQGNDYGAPGQRFEPRMVRSHPGYADDGLIDTRPMHVIRDERDAARRSDQIARQARENEVELDAMTGRARKAGLTGVAEPNRESAAAAQARRVKDDVYRNDGSVLPPALRGFGARKPGLTLKAPAKPKLTSLSPTRDIGLMPQPKATFTPAPTPALAPLVSPAKTAQLHPVTKAKLPPKPKPKAKPAPTTKKKSGSRPAEPDKPKTTTPINTTYTTAGNTTNR